MLKEKFDLTGKIALVREGANVRVRLPRIGAWACGYLSFR